MPVRCPSNDECTLHLCSESWNNVALSDESNTAIFCLPAMEMDVSTNLGSYGVRVNKVVVSGHSKP